MREFAMQLVVSITKALSTFNIIKKLHVSSSFTNEQPEELSHSQTINYLFNFSLFLIHTHSHTNRKSAHYVAGQLDIQKM